MEIIPYVKEADEHGVNVIHVGENAEDGRVQNCDGLHDGEAKYIAGDLCESNRDAGIVPVSTVGRSRHGTRAKTVRTIRNW